MNTEYLRVIENADLVSIAEQAGAQLSHHGGEWRGKCPLHKGNNTTAFAIYNAGDKLRWKCYTQCGGGDVIDFVAAWRGVDPKAAYEWLGGGATLSPQEAAQMAAERAARAAAWEAQKRVEYEQALSELHKARAWERYYQNLSGNEQARGYWREKGVPNDWQDYWSLGYNPDFVYRHNEQLYHSPSLTIPIYNGDSQPANIRHRILKPVDPQDKYRPERQGLKALPFIADPWKVDTLPKALVVEGEVKAMVTYMWMDYPDFQVYGIPGKRAFGELSTRLQGHDVWILFDPDAGDQAREAAKMVNGRVIELTMKVDDALNAGLLGKSGIRRLLTMARKA
jgi:hypothetical protein